MRAYLGDTTGARAAAEELVESGGEVIELYEGVGYSGLSLAAIADGDAQTAHRQGELAWRRAGMRRETVVLSLLALTTLHVGDVVDGAANGRRSGFLHGGLAPSSWR